VTKHKSLHKAAVLALLSLLIAVLILSAGFIALWNGEKLDTAALSNLSNPLVILDTNGDEIDGGKTVKYCKIGDISQHALNAFVAVEDKDFYKHKGLSYKRIASAVINNVRAGYSKEGASTISQQLIKNTHLTHEKTMRRKIREAVLTKKLESNYKKDEILEMYLNAIYFGNNIYGIANAGEFYFGKKPAEFSALEGAGLAGLIQNPKRFDPVANYGKFIARAKLVLRLMRAQGYLTEDEYNNAKNEQAEIVSNKKANIGSPYETAVIAEAAKLLDVGEADIVNCGCRIETYFDPSMQNLIYKYMNEPEYEIRSADGGAADKFAVLTDTNGTVTALWASTPTVLTARRNFGSVIKPLLVYAPALELGAVHAESTVDDSPLIGGDFNPQNVDGKYHGRVSVRESVEQSYNIPAVKILDAVGVGNAGKIARRLGLNIEEENLSAALGNTKNGVSFTELLSGYQTIANSGKNTVPKFIKSVRDRSGKIIYRDTQNRYTYKAQSVGEDTAYLITDILCGVSKRGTGRKLKKLPFQIASKTGTAERENAKTNTDAAFVAYTAENVLLLWAGNAGMKPQQDLPKGTVGGGMLGFIARDIFTELTAGGNALPNFVRPNSVLELKIDTDDQKNGDIRLANPSTRADRTKTALFLARFAPSKVSANNLTAIAPIVDGQIANSAAELWFNVLPHQIYEIYKDGVLQEVIGGRNGEYRYTDKYAGGTSRYFVTAKINGASAKSNEIKLYAPAEKQPHSTVKNGAGAWYF
jgi:membrane peptidoglycan carboxypeptidase